MIRTARARLAMEPLEDRLAPALFAITTAEDAGPGSLRRAIHQANATPGLDMIAFAIPGDGVHTINVQSALPAIIDPVAVGGQTQPGYQGQPLIELNGTNAGIGVQGLVIERGGSGSVIRTLAINRFAMPGPLFEERGADGIRILADSCVVKGCFLGTDPTGTRDLGNARHGVFVTGGSFQSTVGGKGAGAGNVIVHNGGDGVIIGSDPGEGYVTPAGDQNAVYRNRIYDNGGLGIDLGPNDGVSLNDLDDPDNSADREDNRLFNFPVLESAALSPIGLRVTGTLNTESEMTARIEFFASPLKDQSDHDEGRRFLGATTAATGPGENTVEFAKLLPAVSEGRFITATASDALGNTSEFSEDIVVA